MVRGKETESTHRIHAVIARDDGSLVAWHGDPQRPTFPRSAVKAIQALALLERSNIATAGLRSKRWDEFAQAGAPPSQACGGAGAGAAPRASYQTWPA